MDIQNYNEAPLTCPNHNNDSLGSGRRQDSINRRMHQLSNREHERRKGQERRRIKDRRLGLERRKFRFTFCIPERRHSLERRHDLIVAAIRQKAYAN